MNEDESRKKWCPMARFAVDSKGGNSTNRNRRFAEPSDPTCIASDCMAWRQYTVEVAPPDNPTKTVRFTDEPIYTETHGYCGLAGKS